MKTIQDLGRTAGVLLHPTSLPSGKMDSDAFRWLDWLEEAGFGVWQMLPLGVPLVGLSPYQCASAFAINPQLFTPSTAMPSPEKFQTWYAQQQHWVEDYALFLLLKQQFNGQEWHEWPTPYRSRDKATLNQAKQDFADALEHIIHEQFDCWQQWQSVKNYAHERGISLFGDMPIFVAYDSADVWAHPELFLLDEQGQPTLVTGVPPDYFSETGQRWGNPHYNWEKMQADDFQWWKQRLAYHYDFVDLVRIDHFRGLAASWMIKAEEETALNGYWQEVPGDAMLASIQQQLGKHLPLVAEDLGLITPDVIELRDKYALPGMSILQFSFDHFEDNPHKPQNVPENRVFYTGTHDNDTLLGWYRTLEPEVQQHVLQVLNIHDAYLLSSTMQEVLLASNALLVIFPLQDLLYMGSEARMNTPGTTVGNWQWQFAWRDIPLQLASELHNKIQGHQRNERELKSHTTRHTSRPV